MKRNQKSTTHNLQFTTNRDIAIQLVNVSKKYEIHHEKPTLVEKFIKGKSETFFALKNIDLTIYKGEKIGIIGPNGSGKTTLLKIISGITIPTAGVVKTFGRVISLIDLQAGFHSELTGYQNIFLSGMVLGMRKKEIEKKIFDIIAFADIRQFIDIPVYTYSQGMLLRLGFSIAVHADPEILILDENISVGDEEFRKKSSDKLKYLFREGQTIVMVSQWIEILRKNCNEVFVMKQGQLVDEF